MNVLWPHDCSLARELGNAAACLKAPENVSPSWPLSKPELLGERLPALFRDSALLLKIGIFGQIQTARGDKFKYAELRILLSIGA